MEKGPQQMWDLGKVVQMATENCHKTPLSSVGFGADSQHRKQFHLGQLCAHPTFIHISGSLCLFRVRLMHFCSAQFSQIPCEGGTTKLVTLPLMKSANEYVHEYFLNWDFYFISIFLILLLLHSSVQSLSAQPG